jgi:MFS family permease
VRLSEDGRQEGFEGRGGSKRVHSGWWVVASVFVAQLFMSGFYTYGFPLFVVPVQDEFDASVTDVMWSLTGAGFTGLFAAPLFGPLVDRWSARGLMLIGCASLVAALVLMSIATGVVQFAAMFALLVGVATTLLGPITGSAVVSRWFTDRRGQALGIAAMGTSIGGMLLPLVLEHWIDTLGWRGALRALAGMVTLLVVPLLVFALRDRPASAPASATVPGAATAPDPRPPPSGDARVWTTGEILRAPSYWLVSSCLGLLFMSYTAVMSNLGKYVETLSYEASLATTLLSTIALCGLIGKLVFGALADRIPLRVGLWLALLLAGSGISLLTLDPPRWGLTLAAVLMGLAAGGMLPVWGALVAAIFGVASFGRAMGLITPVIGVLVMPGYMIAGASRDATGSYTPALQGFVGAIVCAALLLVALRVPRAAMELEPGSAEDGLDDAGAPIAGSD